MGRSRFSLRYSMVREAYHSAHTDYNSYMDDLAVMCSDEQWNVVEWASDHDFPTLSVIRKQFKEVEL